VSTALHNRNCLSLTTKSQVVRDHKETCFYCGARGQYVDHIEPMRLGGSNARANLTCSCYECNKTKGKWPLQPEALAVTLGGSDGASGHSRLALGPLELWLDRSSVHAVFISFNGDLEIEAVKEWAHQHRVSVGAAVRCMVRFSLANNAPLDDEPDGWTRKSRRLAVARELSRREGEAGDGE
jgi:hypothetical protein